MKKKVSCAVGMFCVLALSQYSLADTLVDRGLPATNLNNAAGSSRSNVAWAYGSNASGTWLVGDDFSISGAGNYHIDSIKVWAVNTDTQLTLWLGEEGESFTQYLSSSSSSVMYLTGNSYQGSSGTYRTLTEYTFTLDLILQGSTDYQFFLGGSASGFTYLHASNAALGGSIADGSDNVMLYGLISSGNITGIGSWNSLGNGWDKSSDANIQVFGAPVPEPATLLLFGTGLVGMAFVGRRKKK